MSKVNVVSISILSSNFVLPFCDLKCDANKSKNVTKIWRLTMLDAPEIKHFALKIVGNQFYKLTLI